VIFVVNYAEFRVMRRYGLICWRCQARERPQLRIICLQAIEEVQQVVGLLASQILTWWFVDSVQHSAFHL